MSAPKVNCRRVYANGDTVLEPRAPGEDADGWLDYNSTFRPGCALLVDGVVKALGYYRPDYATVLEERFASDRRRAG